VDETTFQVQLPVSLLHYGLDRDEIQRRVVEWLVISLFNEERISSGRAARLLGVSRVEFLALLRERGIAYVDYTPDELEEEFAALQALENDLAQRSLFEDKANRSNTLDPHPGPEPP
jgi:predicted HTH domain antitoxin